MRPAVLLLLLCLPATYAQDVDPTAPPTVTAEGKALKVETVQETAAAVEYFVRNVPKGALARWTVEPRYQGDYLRQFVGSSRLIYAGPPGKYVATAKVELFRAASDLSGVKKGDLVPLDVTATELRVEFELGKLPPGPTPPGPTPPGPTPPGPTPPGPTPPGPTPAPIPVPGLHVLLVFETADLSSYPSSMVASWSAASVDAYLKSKNAAVRRWDVNVDASGAEKKWQDAMKRPRAGLPWLIISNGQTGYEGPPPTTAAELLALLKKYGD